MSDRQILEHEPAVVRTRQLRDLVIVYVLVTALVFVLAFGLSVLRWVFDWGQPRQDWSVGGCLAFAGEVALVVPPVLLALVLGVTALVRLRRKVRGRTSDDAAA